MLRLGLVLAGAAALAGCAPKLRAVNETSGIVEYTTSVEGAMKTAEAHCAKSGRSARVSSQNALLGSLAFDCVAK